MGKVAQKIKKTNGTSKKDSKPRLHFETREKNIGKNDDFLDSGGATRLRQTSDGEVFDV